jgi:hypothetical protein
MNPKCYFVDGEGFRVYYDLQRRFHREDGPAYMYSSGDSHWYFHGKLHRIDGPAIEHTNGYRAWFTNGQLHRINGPAIINANGSVEYYFKGIEILKNEYYSFEFQIRMILES